MEEKSNLNKVKENDIYVRLQFYEQMDSLMVNLLVDLAINMVRVLYANKDELANQVVTRTTADPEFRHFIVLTIRAITLMRTLEEENND